MCRQVVGGFSALRHCVRVCVYVCLCSCGTEKIAGPSLIPGVRAWLIPVVSRVVMWLGSRWVRFRHLLSRVFIHRFIQPTSEGAISTQMLVNLAINCNIFSSFPIYFLCSLLISPLTLCASQLCGGWDGLLRHGAGRSTEEVSGPHSCPGGSSEGGTSYRGLQVLTARLSHKLSFLFSFSRKCSSQSTPSKYREHTSCCFHSVGAAGFASNYFQLCFIPHLSFWHGRWR